MSALDALKSLKNFPLLFKIPLVTQIFDVIQKILESRDVTPEQAKKLDKLTFGLLADSLTDDDGPVQPGETETAILAVEAFVLYVHGAVISAVTEGKAKLTAMVSAIKALTV